MVRTVQCIGVVLVVAVASIALADHDISVPYEAPEGTADIDGDLSDWADATWIMLDETYAGEVKDITEAKYALRWSSTTNLLYVAVSVIDTQLNLSDWYDGWNLQDDVELYVDAGNNDVDYGGAQDYAQQMTMGTDGVAPDWAVFAAGQPHMVDLCPEYNTEVNGNTITHEASFVPYSYYTGFGGTALPLTEVTLAVDLEIGFDCVVLSRADDDTYGMASNNLASRKFCQSYSFQTWKLVAGGPVLQADFDDDGDVDLDDFVILKNNFGLTPPADGDADGDGDVDLDDFVILKNEFGS